ncbi:MAG: hypothetical protein Q6373_010680, partial [Candidatus Sigynarchaeota archaeon]
MPKDDWRRWPRFSVSPLIELVYNPKTKIVEVYVDGRQSLTCAALVASIDDLARYGKDIKAIEDMATLPGVQLVEGYAAEDVFGTPEAELAAHASNLQAWVEHDYDTHLLHCNIAFPLLVDLARAGDEKARRVMEATIDERIRDGSSTTRKAIALMFLHYLSEAQWDVLLADPDPEVRAKALEYLPGPLFTPARLARALDDAALWTGPRPLGALALHNKRLDAYETWTYDRASMTWIEHHDESRRHRPNPLFPEGSISRKHLEFMARVIPGLAATYPFLSADLIREIAHLPEGHSAGALALHPNTPEDVLVYISKMEAQLVVFQALARRPGLPEHLVKRFIIE